MPNEEKPNATAALERAGLLKPDQNRQTEPPPVQPKVDPPAEKQTDGKMEIPEFKAIPKAGEKPPVQPVEVPPETVDTTLPENTRKVVTSLRSHIKNLEGQLRMAKSEHNQDEVKSLKQQLEQAHDQIAELDLTRDPRFQAQFDQPRNAVKEQIKTILETFGAVAEEILPALEGKSFKEQIEYIRENAPDTVGALTPLLGKLVEIDGKRSEILKNKMTARQELLARAQQEEQQQMDQAMEIVFQHEANANEPLLKEIPGQDEFNANVTKLKQFARSIAKDASPLNRATLAVGYAQGKVYRQLFQKEQMARFALEKQLSDLRQAMPDGRGMRAPDAGGGPRKDAMSPAEAARAVASRM